MRLVHKKRILISTIIGLLLTQNSSQAINWNSAIEYVNHGSHYFQLDTIGSTGKKGEFLSVNGKEYYIPTKDETFT